MVRHHIYDNISLLDQPYVNFKGCIYMMVSMKTNLEAIALKHRNRVIFVFREWWLDDMLRVFISRVPYTSDKVQQKEFFAMREKLN